MNINRGDIWYIESGYSTGSEQRPGRPAIIVSNQRNNENSSTVEVVYLTTQPKHDLPTHVTIRSLSRESIAICEQISTVSTERMGNYRGCVTDAEMASVELSMLISLGMQVPETVRTLTEDPEDEWEPCEQSAEMQVPVVDTQTIERLATAEAKVIVLQQMYDSLLDKILRSGK